MLLSGITSGTKISFGFENKISSSRPFFGDLNLELLHDLMVPGAALPSPFLHPLLHLEIRLSSFHILSFASSYIRNHFFNTMSSYIQLFSKSTIR